jgi:acyl carrier protein
MKIEQVKKIVIQSLTDVLKENNIHDEIFNDQTEIFGETSIIDSLQLVSLIVKIEEEVFEQTGKEIIVVDDAAIIVGKSPFQTIQSLSSFIFEKIEVS